MKTLHWQTPRGSIFTSKSTILQWTIYMTGLQHYSAFQRNAESL
jgi:hypothetical protein